MKTFTNLVALAILGLLTACEQENAAEGPNSAGAPPPVQVTTLMVTPRNVPVSFEYTGQVAGSHEVEVRSRVSGIIEKRLYDEGTYVTAGKTLFEIDSASYRAQMAEAKAALASARASKTSALAQLKKAQRDYARIIPLAKRNLLSQSVSDDAESGLEIAKAAVQLADAAILQAKATIQSVQVNLDYTAVKAPISGIAGRAMKMEGSLVQAGSDSLLTTLSQTNPAYVNFGIPEPEQIQQQQEIAAKTLRLPDKGFEVALTSSNGKQLQQTGAVNFEDYKIDPKTGNFAVRATIDNTNRKLSPGQFVRVILKGAVRPNAILVPQRAVLDNPQGKYVYVVGKSKGKGKNQPEMTIAEQRAVEVGEWVQLEGELKNAWIIKSGLKKGDQVVTEGMARIFFPGMPIQPSTANDKSAISNHVVNGSKNNEIHSEIKKDIKSDIKNAIESEIQHEIENEMKNTENTPVLSVGMEANETPSIPD